MCYEGLREAFQLLDEGVNKKIFPGAVACIGDKDCILMKKVCGNRQLYPYKEKMKIDTLFDLASLTKVVSAVPLTMRLLEKGRISLYDSVGLYLKEFKAQEELKIIHLLTHTSGFKPFFPLYKECSSFYDAIKYIANSERSFVPGEKVLYSDNNFILIKAVLEIITGEDFDVSCEKEVFAPLGMKNTCFNLPITDNTAATEKDIYSKKYLKGIVHDENARFFNGVSGHAGAFSDLYDLSKYCRMYLNDGKLQDGKVFLSSHSIHCIIHNYTNNLNESRGLGFCIKNYDNSSGGELITSGAFGHTGFTGTSLWIDKELEIYIILLTNRVHPTRDNNEIIRFRRLFHNAVISAYR